MYFSDVIFVNINYTEGMQCLGLALEGGGGGFEKVEKHLLMLHKGKQEDWQA